MCHIFSISLGLSGHCLLKFYNSKDNEEISREQSNGFARVLYRILLHFFDILLQNCTGHELTFAICMYSFPVYFWHTSRLNNLVQSQSRWKTWMTFSFSLTSSSWSLVRFCVCRSYKAASLCQSVRISIKISVMCVKNIGSQCVPTSTTSIMILSGNCNNGQFKDRFKKCGTTSLLLVRTASMKVYPLWHA